MKRNVGIKAMYSRGSNPKTKDNRNNYIYHESLKYMYIFIYQIILFFLLKLMEIVLSL